MGTLCNNFSRMRFQGIRLVEQTEQNCRRIRVTVIVGLFYLKKNKQHLAKNKLLKLESGFLNDSSDSMSDSQKYDASLHFLTLLTIFCIKMSAIRLAK